MVGGYRYDNFPASRRIFKIYPKNQYDDASKEFDRILRENFEKCIAATTQADKETPVKNVLVNLKTGEVLPEDGFFVRVTDKFERKKP